jgi:hypothetical protein
MAKSPKPNTARNQPAPSNSHADIDDWIRRVMPDLHPTVKWLDESIRRTIPGLVRRLQACRERVPSW